MRFGDAGRARRSDCDAAHPPPLAIGARLRTFSCRASTARPTRSRASRTRKALVVIFTAVHCPTAEIYEGRIKRLVADYRPKGVAFAVIQPNNAKALRLDEMGYTDLGDSLEDMKIRAAHRKFNFPFLYDGETQEVARQVRTGSDAARLHLRPGAHARYQGRVDSNPREALAKVARRAQRARCGAGRHAGAGREDANRRLLDQVARQGGAARRRDDGDRDRTGPAREDRCRAGSRRFVKNATGKTLLVNFWATWCAPCTAEFPELQKTFRMYRKRPFDLVTVSINYPGRGEGRPQVPREPARLVPQPAVRHDGSVRADEGASIPSGTAACRTRW